MITFDVETTGTETSDDDIIEVGIVRTQGDDIVETYSELVTPEQEIPQEVVELTGITNEDVQKKGVSWRSAARKIYAWMRDAERWCAYNRSFDVGFLQEGFHRLGGGLPEAGEVADPFRMACHRWPDMASKKLSNVADRCGVSLQNAHRAVHDAEATWKVWRKLKEAFGIENYSDTWPLGPYHQGEDPIRALYSGLPRRQYG